MIDIETAAPFVRQHRGQILVIKIGGACLVHPASVRRLAREIALAEALGALPVVVHGAGPQTDVRQRELGEEPVKIDGRRVTSATGLKALRQATRGELGDDLAAAIEMAGAPAISFSGASCIVAERRAPVLTEAGMTDYGAVGDIVNVDPGPIEAMIAAGHIPVVSPPVSDGNGGFLNVNADVMAARLAESLDASKLILVTSVTGIFEDPTDPTSALSVLDLTGLGALEESGALQGGMAVKAHAIRIALEAGIPRVHVIPGLEPQSLTGELFTTQGTGTLITTEPTDAPAHAEGTDEPTTSAGTCQ